MMDSIITFAATHTHIAMGLAIFLYMWIAAGNWYMGNKWIALVWVSYAFSNVWFMADWLEKQNKLGAL